MAYLALEELSVYVDASAGDLAEFPSFHSGAPSVCAGHARRFALCVGVKNLRGYFEPIRMYSIFILEIVLFEKK